MYIVCGIGMNEMILRTQKDNQRKQYIFFSRYLYCSFSILSSIYTYTFIVLMKWNHLFSEALDRR